MTRPPDAAISRRKRLRWWWRDFRCLRLGWHKVGFHWEDGDGVYGDDCRYCGAGPLR